jgi:ABC-2 type transport system permease protein
MRVLDLALKDLYQLVKDWKTFLFLLAMPLVFTLLFGTVFSGGDGDPRLPVVVLDQDQGGALGARLVTLMAASDVIRPVVAEATDATALAEQVQDEDVAAAVIVPEGYSESVWEGAPLPVRLIADPNSEAAQTVQTHVQGVVSRLLTAVQAAQLTVDALAEAAPERYADPVAREAALQDALTDAVAAWEDPPFTVKAAGTGQREEGAAEANAFAHSSAGMMAQFAIAGLIGAAEILVAERKTRTLQRMLTTTMSRLQVLAGHFLAMFVMILGQLMLLVIVGQLFFGVPYANAPLATLLVVSAFAFFTGGLGLLIGGLSKNEEQVIIFSLLPMFVLSGLGGAWVPLEFTSETVQLIGRFTPTAWAIEGLKNITVRGLGLPSVILPAVVVLGFGVLCLVVAIWQFRVE